MAVLQVQNVHHFLLSDEKDKDTRIVREGPEGDKKKLHEKVGRGGEPQITTEREIPQGKKTRVWEINSQGTREGRNSLMSVKFVLQMKRKPQCEKHLKYTWNKNRRKVKWREKEELFLKIIQHL